MLSATHELVLVAEDDEGDQLLLRRAVSKLTTPIEMRTVPDGKEVVNYFNGEGAYGDRDRWPVPTLLLLDLKMPRMDGFQVLEWLQNNPHCVVPTLVWTASGMREDVDRAYQLGANAYMIKPHRFEDMQRMLELAFNFWRCCEKPTSHIGYAVEYDE